MNKDQLLFYGRDQDVYYAQQYVRSMVELSQTEQMLKSLQREKSSRIARLRQKTGSTLIALGSKLIEGTTPVEPLVLSEECV